MKAKELFAALSKSLNTNSQLELAKTLGVTAQTVITWKKQNKNVTPLQMARLLTKARKAAVKQSQHNSIKPIVEHFEVARTQSRGGANYEVFDAKSSIYLKGLRKELEAQTGIYIFYDSGGRALYAGKARRQTLWKEMNHAFNRSRLTQTLFQIAHPHRNQLFKPQYEQARQPRRCHLRLHELAAYFSAYAIDDGMIEDLEALIVRGFANDLLNIRMETFAHARQGV